MKLGSLFDGSGGFPLAGVMNGITPAWAAEIEPYPIAVTRSRFPGMRHYGNVCDINGAEIEPVDIITAGSPCQDMSVAGLRAGIYEGKRSNLFFESIRIVKEMRAATNGKYPRFFVWENVPGAFSSDKGGAFQAVLQAVCSVADDTVSIPAPKSNDGTDRLVWLNAGCVVGSGYSVAWRTLDAQYWGVPQRRKRIYLVADFTSRRAGEILFKPDSLRGDLQTGNETGQEAAADAMGCADGSNGCVACSGKQQSLVTTEDCANTLGANDWKEPQAVCYAMQRSDEYQKCNVASTQSARQYKSATDLVVEKKRKYIIRRLTPTECARLQGFPDNWGQLAPYNPADAEFWEGVRKTHAEINGKKYKPLKNIKGWYGKLHNDGAEYKMWGNGIALPCAEYVIRGIKEV